MGKDKSPKKEDKKAGKNTMKDSNSSFPAQPQKQGGKKKKKK